MNFQFLLAFGFLFLAISCTGLVTTLLELLGLTGNGNNAWSTAEKVQKCYDGCVNVFERYPLQIHGIGDNLMDSFKSYIDAANMWNTSASTILSARSTNLLETISLLENLGTSPDKCLDVLSIENTKLFVAYRAIVDFLSEYINELTQTIKDDLTELESSFVDLFNKFNKFCLLDCNQLNFTRIMKSGQRLANTVNLIVDTALNHPSNETIANGTYEALAILVCILFDNFLNIQGAIISKAAVLKSSLYTITSIHLSCLTSLDPFIRGIATSMNTLLTVGIAQGVRDLSASLVVHMGDFNSALNTLFGPFSGIVIPVETVLGNLMKSGQ